MCLLINKLKCLMSTYILCGLCRLCRLCQFGIILFRFVTPHDGIIREHRCSCIYKHTQQPRTYEECVSHDTMRCERRATVPCPHTRQYWYNIQMNPKPDLLF